MPVTIDDLPTTKEQGWKISPVSVCSYLNKFSELLSDYELERLGVKSLNDANFVIRGEDGLDYKLGVSSLIEYLKRTEVKVTSYTTKETMGDRSFEVTYNLSEPTDIEQVQLIVEGC